MKKTLLYLFFISLSSYINAQTWTSQATAFANPTRGVRDIKIIDANTVWALGYDGTGSTTAPSVQEFTRTTDGGSNWVQGTIDVGNTSYEMVNLTAVDATTAWVGAIDPSVTGVTDPNDGIGVIYKTIDGGTTWNRQNTTAFQIAGSSFLDGVHFFDANTGVSWGDPVGTTFELYRTTDGGTTWSAITTPTITTGDYAYAGSYDSVGNALWFGTAKGKIYRTLDAGATWTKLNTPITDFGHSLTANSGQVHFSDANNGILIATIWSNATSTATVTSRKLYKTTNGGTTWSAATTYTAPYTSNLCYIPGTTMLVATGVTGSGATAVYSDGLSADNGTTWTQIDSGTQRTSIAFLNNTTGWAGGFSSDPFTDGIFKFSGTLLSNNNFASSNNFKVYPNPANNVITVSSNNIDSYKLKVTDITGKVVLEKTLNGIQNSIDISSLSNGAYFFTFNSDDKIETKKIIKN